LLADFIYDPLVLINFKLPSTVNFYVISDIGTSPIPTLTLDETIFKKLLIYFFPYINENITLLLVSIYCFIPLEDAFRILI
jgi:hypothetical protein